MPRRQVVLALPVPSALPPPHLRTTTTKMAGRREKPIEVVLAHSAPNAPPPPVHTTAKREGRREKPLEVALDQCAPNAPPPPVHTTTKREGRREKPIEEVLDQFAHSGPPPPDHTTTTAITTKRVGTREKAKEVGLALSPPNALPPPLNITTAATNDGTKMANTVSSAQAIENEYSLRPRPPPSMPACHGQKRKQEEGAAAPALQEPEKKKRRLKVVRIRFLDPDATESSSEDEEYTPQVTNGRKRKEVEIVHLTKILGKNANSKRRKTQETITETTRNIIKDQKNEEKLVGEKIVIKKETGSSSSFGEKVKKPSSTSSTAGKKKKKAKAKTKKKTEVVDVLWEIPGEIPDLDVLEKEKHRLLYRFFDGIPEDCEDIPPEVKVVK